MNHVLGLRTEMSSPPNHSDLVRRAVAGDRAALTLVLTETRDEVCRQVAGRIPSSLAGLIDADDVVQEAHVEAFRHIREFEDRGPDALLRWVSTIALRKLRDAIKMRQALKRGGGQIALTNATADSAVALLDYIAEFDHTPSRSVARREIVSTVQDALALLPDDYRRAVNLVYVQGVSVAQAAADMGRTERAIHNLCFKARNRLRDLIGNNARFRSRSG